MGNFPLQVNGKSEQKESPPASAACPPRSRSARSFKSRFVFFPPITKDARLLQGDLCVFAGVEGGEEKAAAILRLELRTRGFADRQECGWHGP